MLKMEFKAGLDQHNEKRKGKNLVIEPWGSVILRGYNNEDTRGEKKYCSEGYMKCSGRSDQACRLVL